MRGANSSASLFKQGSEEPLVVPGVRNTWAEVGVSFQAFEGSPPSSADLADYGGHLLRKWLAIRSSEGAKDGGGGGNRTRVQT